jgi:hypothetical protein
MIDIKTEPLLSIPQAVCLFPPVRQGRQVSRSCIHRWILTGARGPGGERVRLEALRVGARWATSMAAVERFLSRLTPEVGGPAPRSRTARQRERANDRAARQLETLGI